MAGSSSLARSLPKVEWRFCRYGNVLHPKATTAEAALVRLLVRQGSRGGRTGRVVVIVSSVVELDVEGLIKNQIEVVDIVGDLERVLGQRLLLKQ